MDYKVHFDLSNIYGFGAVFQNSLAPVLSQAVGQVAYGMAADWQEKILSAGGKGGIYAEQRDAYAASVKVEFKPGDLQATIVSDYQQASDIEEGRPARDLKAMLNTSPKTRMAKDGKKYLIIPFYHTQASLPPQVKKQALQMGPSWITGKKWASNGFGGGGIFVLRNTYHWDRAGDRFTSGKKNIKTHLSIGALPAGLAPKLQPFHATDIYAGMRRMEQGTDKSARTGMLTFRVMKEGSPKWIVPAKPGLFLVRGVTERGQAQLDAAVSAAMSNPAGWS